MTPNAVRMLRSHAAMVQDRLDRALQLETPERKSDFEWAETEFNKRYPHYNWRDWTAKAEEISR